MEFRWSFDKCQETTAGGHKGDSQHLSADRMYLPMVHPIKYNLWCVL